MSLRTDAETIYQTAIRASLPDRAVQENDTVSVRGLGKLRVLALGGLTKKGRLALTLGKYL